MLYTFDTEGEVIEVANSKPGGLSASVYTASLDRGLWMSRLLQFGQVQVNESTMYLQPNTPCTGWKSSG